MLSFAKITLPIAHPIPRQHSVPGPPGPPGPPPPATSGGPNLVGSLLAWYRPDTLPLVDGSVISLWQDSTGHGFNTVPVDTAHKPIVTRNAIAGFSAVTSSSAGSNRGLQYVNPLYPTSNISPAFNTPDTWSVFAIVKWQLNSGFTFFMGDGGNYGVRLGLTGGKFRITLCDVGDYDSNETLVLGNWYALLVVSKGGIQSVWANRVRLTGYSGTHHMSYQSGVIGAADAAGTFDGQLAELAFYNKAVGVTGRRKLFRYARSNYGI